MRSAACGAENFYTTVNNPARFETLDEARALDELTLNAWIGAPHLQVIENVSGQTFEHKINLVLGGLARILGIPEPLECERKFRLTAFSRDTLPKETVDIDIVQTYLVAQPGTDERVRARGQHNNWVYYHTTKERRGPGVTVERERMLSKHEYDALLVRRDCALLPIRKTRSCFVHEGQYCEVDQFHGHQKGLVLLEIELTDIQQEVTVPCYLGHYEEVTDDRAFSNVALAAAL
jgi:CYTH domain-containing protein